MRPAARYLLVTLGVLLASPAGAFASGWTPPIGIPHPDFGVNEAAPSWPQPWSGEVPGFYFVDYAIGSDTGRTYGQPSAPRKTIPLALPAGSVVALSGTYSRNHSSPYHVVASGTAARPVFIRSYDPQNPATVTAQFRVNGTHFIIERITFTFTGTGKGLLALGGPAQYAVLRDCEVTGNSSGGGISLVGFDDARALSNIVLLRNNIHDNGDLHATYDQDVHGITVNARVSRLWVIDNEIARNSGTGIQINATSLALQPTVHHIYVGRNVSHHNKQSGFSTKQSVDTIFSQNVAYGHRPSNSSRGAGLHGQYGPERVWYIFNHVYDNQYGIDVVSTSGLGTGSELFFVGNVIRNIHYEPSAYNTFNAGSAWSTAGITLADGHTRYIVNNTLDDVDGGINVSGGGAVLMANNVIGRITRSDGYHLFIEHSTAASHSAMFNTILEGNTRVRWGSSEVLDLSALALRYPDRVKECLNVSPLYRDSAAGDYRLAPGSPAVDGGIEDAVYARFEQLYGLSLARDAAGAMRPAGGRYDIGAYEFGATAAPVAPHNVIVK